MLVVLEARDLCTCNMSNLFCFLTDEDTSASVGSYRMNEDRCAYQNGSNSDNEGMWMIRNSKSEE